MNHHVFRRNRLRLGHRRDAALPYKVAHRQGVLNISIERLARTAGAGTQ